MKNNRGVTLVELMVVLSIAAILAVALGFSYQGWMGSYKIEREIKTLYSALLDARARAVQENRNYFMDISTNGMFYRISRDDSNGVTKPAPTAPQVGDGIFQQQATWAVIQASSPVNWGNAAAVTTDTTVTTLSRKLDLSNTTATAAGLLSARNVTQGTYGFAIGFDNRGLMKNMRGSPPGAAPRTNIADPLNIFPITQGGGLSICIFTDYDNNQTSKYNPDYDCINIMDTRISIGKLDKQNTAGGACDALNCIAK